MSTCDGIRTRNAEPDDDDDVAAAAAAAVADDAGGVTVDGGCHDFHEDYNWTTRTKVVVGFGEGWYWSRMVVPIVDLRIANSRWSCFP